MQSGSGSGSWSLLKQKPKPKRVEGAQTTQVQGQPSATRAANLLALCKVSVNFTANKQPQRQLQAWFACKPTDHWLLASRAVHSICNGFWSALAYSDSRGRYITRGRYMRARYLPLNHLFPIKTMNLWMEILFYFILFAASAHDIGYEWQV